MSLKVLHIIPNLLKGGAERLVLDICNELEKRVDVKVKLITFRNDNDYEFMSNELDHEVIPSRFIPSVSGKSIIEVKKLQKKINDFKPDIIHSHLFESEIVLSQISDSASKYFVHVHDNMLQLTKMNLKTLSSKYSMTNYYERTLVLKSYKEKNPHFVSISRDTKTFIEKNVPSTYRCTLLLNAINTKRFENLDKKRNTYKLLNIGSLVLKKGQNLAIEVVKLLKDRSIDVSLDILGEGALRLKLESLINRLGLEGQVKLHGKVNFPEKFMDDTLVYLHTASSEPFGLVLVEAMAAGVPVVCTDGKGNRDIIEDGRNGYIIYERSAEKIADKIELLINNESIWQEMSTYAKSYSKQFDIKKYVDELLELYLG